MKKFRTIVLATAILAGIGSSMAFKSYCWDCRYATQYVQKGGSGGYFVPAGEEGIQYICIQAPQTCTYWNPTSPGAPPMVGQANTACQQGYYDNNPGLLKKSK
jgi:hypothetical protein